MFTSIILILCDHLCYQLFGDETSLTSCQSLSYYRISQHFTKSEGSVLYSQGPSNDPYPEPDEFNPYHHIPFL
jgi:hypothetical protein